MFRAIAAELLRAMAGAAGPDAARARRLMYAKTVVGVTNARLVVDAALPADLAVGHFQPGARWPVALRLSNGSGVLQADSAPDMRGLALRICLADGGWHDLVFANFPTALARDGRQFFELAMASLASRPALFARLAETLGEAEGHRIAAGLKASLRLTSSLALEHFWSGCAFLWGEAPVRLGFRPIASGLTPPAMTAQGQDVLKHEFARRLARGAVRYRLTLQRYVNETCTPIEDASTDWSQEASPPLEVATLVIPKQDILTPAGQGRLALVEALAFSPWNAPDAFRPLGSLNRLRRWTYPMADAASPRPPKGPAPSA